MMLRCQNLLHYHVKLHNHLMLRYQKEMRMKRMNRKQIREVELYLQENHNIKIDLLMYHTVEPYSPMGSNERIKRDMDSMVPEMRATTTLVTAERGREGAKPVREDLVMRNRWVDCPERRVHEPMRQTP